PAVPFPADMPGALLHLGEPALEPRLELLLLLGRERGDHERLARLDAYFCEAFPHRNLHRSRSRRRAERQREIEIAEGIGIGRLLVDLRPHDRRFGGRCGLILELREWQRAVSGLDLLHIVEVSRVEELRADDSVSPLPRVAAPLDVGPSTTRPKAISTSVRVLLRIAPCPLS